MRLERLACGCFVAQQAAAEGAFKGRARGEAKASLQLLRPCKGSLVRRKGLLKKLPAPRTQILHQDDSDA